MAQTLIVLTLLLFAGHALADYPLQGDFLARGKNKWLPLPGAPWYQCLFAHALIHAGVVLLITRRVELALAELLIHFATDHAKCAGAFGDGERAFNIDQAIHYGCKVLYAAAIAVWLR